MLIKLDSSKNQSEIRRKFYTVYLEENGMWDL